jgi:tetratricopeptide (TPR) repeat protein
LWRQLQDLERANLIGEASLISLQLVRLDPLFTEGWLAAVRTALIQERLPAAAELCLEAVAAGQNPVLFDLLRAHILVRAGDGPALRRFAEDKAKEGNERPGLERLDALRVLKVARDYTPARVLLDRLDEELWGNDYAATLLGLRLRQTEGASQAFQRKVGTAFERALASDLEGWEKNALLLQWLGDQLVVNLEGLLDHLRKALGSSSDAQEARALVDKVLEGLRERRLLAGFLRLVEGRSLLGDDIAAYAGARARRVGGDTTGALQLLDTVSTSLQVFVRREKAELLLAVGRPVDALEPLSRLLEETPADVRLRLDLAEALLTNQRARESLDVVDGVSRSLLTPDQQQRAGLLAVRAAAQLSPQIVANTWLELARTARPEDWSILADETVRVVAPDWREKTRQILKDGKTTVSLIGEGRPEALDLVEASFLRQEGKAQAALEKTLSVLRALPDNSAMTVLVAQRAKEAGEIEVSLTLEVQNQNSQSTAPAAPRLVLTNLAVSEIEIAAIRRLMLLEPDRDEHLLALFQAFQARGEVERAKGAVVAAVGADREDAAAAVYARAARVLDDAGFPIDALPYYRRAVTDPDDLESWLRYAGALREGQDTEKAILVCQTILEKGFHGRPFAQAPVLLALQRMMLEEGRRDEFIQWLRERRTKEIPGRDRFLLEASRLLAAEGQTTDALLMIREGLAAAPAGSSLGAELTFLQARLRFEIQEYEAAARLFSNVADRFPNSALAVPALYNAGDVWRRAGSPRLAIDRWTALANRFPRNDSAVAALFEAGMVAYTDLNDSLLARSLFRQLVESGIQDLHLVAAARRNMERLDAGLDPLAK